MRNARNRSWRRRRGRRLNDRRARRAAACSHRRTAIASSTSGNSIRISVPSNWRQLAGQRFGDLRAGRRVWPVNGSERVHARRRTGRGAQPKRTICRRRPTSSSTRCRRANPRMSRPGGYDRVNVATGPASAPCCPTRLKRPENARTSKSSPRRCATAALLYTIAVAPSGEYSSYRSVFNRIVNSIELR